MVPPPPKNPNLYAYHLCFLLVVSTTTLSTALSSSSYSSACPSLKPALDSHTEAFFFFEIKYCCDIVLIKQLVQYNLVLNANWSNSKPFVTTFIFAA
jgi:hypothetical protein